MIEKIKYWMSKRLFHSSIMIIIISIIIFIVGINVLMYTVEGETNMPFNLTKIIVVSSAEGIDIETDMQNQVAAENSPVVQEKARWNFDINQNNDIYLYIEKNPKFPRQEIITNIIIDNIKVEKQGNNGEINYYRPNINEQGGNFSNTKENLVESLKYEGDLETNLKTLKVANQGGMIVFRCANDKIAKYQSNDEEINHLELLKKAGVIEESLKGKLKFDITITTEKKKEYKASIELDIPVQDIIEKGTTSLEITDLADIIFKRTKN